MKIIVFGGSGFLGSHVTDSLIESGHDVTVFDLKPYSYENLPEMITGDILDEHAVFEAVCGADIVYNFAGIASLDKSATKPTDTVRLNVLGNCNIMSACVEYGIKRYIYASTIYVHSDKGGFYRCSKQASEIYLEEYGRKYGLAHTVLRYGSLYGMRADEENGIYGIVKEALTKGRITYNGTGEELREYIHVKDAANLSVTVLDEQYANKHIIITGAAPYRAKNILNTIKDILDKPIEFIFTGESSSLHYNITPYVYKPHYSFKLTSNYYRDLGQGLFEVIAQVDGELKKEFGNEPLY